MKSERELVFTDDVKGPIYRYPNGDLRTAKGHWYERGKTPAPVFDSAGSQLAIARKKQIQAEREETFRGEVRRTLRKKKKTATAEQAVAQMVGDLIDDAAKDGTRPADKLSITKYTAEQAGMAHKEQSAGPAITLEMTMEAVERFCELTGKRVDTIDGEYEEIE